MLPSTITTLGVDVFYDCSSLTLVHLPDNLIAISTKIFEGCASTLTIKGPSCSTTTFDNSLLRFEDMLIEAGFGNGNPNDIICGKSKRPNWLFDEAGSMSQIDIHDAHMYYNWKIWAKTRSLDGRLPLVTAAVRSLKWSIMRQIFAANMPIIHEIDEMTGLPPFMLAAIGKDSDLESIYNLMKEYPSIMSFNR